MAGEQAAASGGPSPRASPLAAAVSTASADAALVSESLEGLVSAVDELKRSMGLGEAVDLSEIELFIQRLRTENEEFRQYAEQAILVRPRGGCGRLRAVAGRAAGRSRRNVSAARCRLLQRRPGCRLRAEPAASPARTPPPPPLPQSAQRLKEERDELQDRLDQAALETTMGAALAETQARARACREGPRCRCRRRCTAAAAACCQPLRLSWLIGRR